MIHMLPLVLLGIFSSTLAHEQPYPSQHYTGVVTKVVDGDTIDATLNLGFGITKTHRFRIKGFDSAETWRPRSNAERIHGKLATDRAIELLQTDNPNLIFSVGHLAAYGRYEVNIFLPDGTLFRDVMKKEGFEKRSTYKD